MNNTLLRCFFTTGMLYEFLRRFVLMVLFLGLVLIYRLTQI